MSLAKLVRPELVLFDWDNTLVDTASLVFAALDRLFEAFDMPPLDEAQRKTAMNSSMRERFPLIFGEAWEKARDDYYRYYDEESAKGILALRDAEACLQHIGSRDIAMGVVSNKGGDLLRKEVMAMGWGDYFCAVVGAGDAKQDKPSPLLFDELLQIRQAPCSPNTAWVVGDSVVDMEFARNIGAFGVYVRNNSESQAPEISHAAVSHLGEIQL